MDREQELRTKIAKASEAARRALNVEIKPWLDELMQIEMCKPPAPVVLPDGRMMVYIGPLPVLVDGKARYPEAIDDWLANNPLPD